MNTDKSKNLSLIEHLLDLRYLIIICLSSIIIGTAIAYNFIDKIFQKIILTLPYVVYYDPIEGITVPFGLAVIFGFLFALPILIAEIWKFVSPALYKNEKKFLSLLCFISVGTFFLGALVTYNYLIPFFLKLSLSQHSWLVPMISSEEYLRFFFTLIFITGLLFEILPLSFTLAYYKIIESDQMKKFRPIAWGIFFIFSMNVINTDDLFYLIGIWIIWIIIYEAIRISIKIFRIFLPSKQSLAG